VLPAPYTPTAVSPDTLERARSAISRSGYVPNLMAGGLASNRSRLVAALVPTIAGPVFLETIQALTDTLAQAGCQRPRAGDFGRACDQQCRRNSHPAGVVRVNPHGAHPPFGLIAPKLSQDFRKDSGRSMIRYGTAYRCLGQPAVEHGRRLALPDNARRVHMGTRTEKDHDRREPTMLCTWP